MDNSELIVCIEKLVGKKNVKLLWEENRQNHSISNMGHSQLNEILIAHGCRITSNHFFQKFWGESIQSIHHFHEGIDDFRKAALILYGNISYGYKILTEMSKKDFDKTFEKTKKLTDESYKSRHNPIYKIQNIEGKKTPLTGYFLQEEIIKRKNQDPNNEKVIKLWQDLHEIKEVAEYNHNAYLCSDHMDVYVATSMRKPHEFLLVNQFCNRVFSPDNILINNLKIRWFDPTQACCSDRIDKGLSEALMLKRAKCTIYLIQESDTLGKASEMASTLAQGKTVIAYVPKVDSSNEANWINWFENYSSKPYFDDFNQESILKELARIYCSNKLLNTGRDDNEFKDWFFGRNKISVDIIVKNIVNGAKELWDQRASTLRDIHPLGIQVDLQTGVANGVLVVRDENTCINLIHQVILNQMEFEVEDKNGYVFLREKKTGCIYRVSSNDSVLVNSFWNYYIK
jgi:hypothetical protein